MPKLSTPQLLEIFQKVKPLLQEYVPPLVARADSEGRYDLWSEKPVIIEGRKRNELAFATLLIQRSYVGFYFMPTYTHEETKDTVAPELLQKLKGKSCFHLTEASPATLGHLKDALAQGFARYQRQGWV